LREEEEKGRGEGNETRVGVRRRKGRGGGERGIDRQGKGGGTESVERRKVESEKAARREEDRRRGHGRGEGSGDPTLLENMQPLYGSLSAGSRWLQTSDSIEKLLRRLAPIMRPLPPSSGASATLSHCNPFSWPFLQLGCRFLFPAAPAAIMRPLSPSCGALAAFSGPCCQHATLAAIKRPPAAIVQPLPPSCGPCCHHAATAATMWPLSPSCRASAMESLIWAPLRSQEHSPGRPPSSTSASL
jgi:hypothetical protein